MNIQALEQYVAQKNQWRGLFGERPLSLLSATDRQRIAETIDSELSPENLTCDGELSGTQVRARQRTLMRVAQELRSIDPSVEMYEDLV